uniref:Uncharacterized protein n=1 Tax=Arundo donax TaxID=35708 RepID=A0A0A8YIB4_ARUDO
MQVYQQCAQPICGVNLSHPRRTVLTLEGVIHPIQLNLSGNT